MAPGGLRVIVLPSAERGRVRCVIEVLDSVRSGRIVAVAEPQFIGVANILVDPRPRYAEYNKDGSELWVTSEVGGTVSVIDPIKHIVRQKITFDVPGLAKEQIQPVGIRFSADGKLAFVATGPANRVAVIDAATKQVLKYLLVGQRVWQLELTPDGKYLLTTNGVSNDVSVIDVAALKVIKSIPVGSFPWGVAISKQ